jgi:1,2-diacylglycerol 3-alpha-glucosyltransferase
MRIAFFSDNAYPEMSGIVDSILTVSEELIRRGHEVTWVGPRYASRDYSLVGRQAPEEEEIIHGIRMIRLPSLPIPKSPTGQSRLAFPTGAGIRALKAFKPDVIHTHSPYGIGIEALRAAKHFRVPLIGTNHTPIEEYFPVGKSLARRFDAWYYNHCVFVTTPYAELIEHMRRAGFRSPARELPNPAPLSLFRPPHTGEREEMRQKLSLTGPVALYCGNFFTGKKIDVVIRAIQKLVTEFPTLTLLLVGRGEEEQRLQTLVSEIGLGKRVRYAGFVRPEELLPYYLAADLFVIMSIVDTQSLTLMQAFASGLPAVGARARGLPDFLPSTASTTVEPGDVDGCANAMREILTQDSLRAQMGRNSVEYVQQFSPSVVAARWEELYKKQISVS